VRGEQALRAGQLRLERLEQLRDRDGSEHDGRLARLGGLRRALVEAVPRVGGERGEVEPGRADRRGLRAAGRVDLGGGERALLERADAAGRSDRDSCGSGA
jgi:hypothetical protein